MATRAQMRTIKRIYDPLALCAGYRQLGIKAQNCDHSFAGTRAVLLDSAPDVDADVLIDALEAAGAHCDCEVMYNICPQTGA